MDKKNEQGFMLWLAVRGWSEEPSMLLRNSRDVTTSGRECTDTGHDS